MRQKPKRKRADERRNRGRGKTYNPKRMRHIAFTLTQVCWFESLAVAFTTAGINLRAFVAALEQTVRGARGRAAQRAAAGHVAGLEAAAAAQISAENDEAAAQEAHFKAHFALHAAQWAPQSLAALQAGAERAAAERAAAASSTQGSQDHEYVYVPVSDSD